MAKPEPKVAEELAKLPEEGYEHFWLWMDDIHKLHQQLKACQ